MQGQEIDFKVKFGKVWQTYFKLVSEALAANPAASSLAPSAPRLFQLTSKDVSEVLTASPAASSLAPFEPSELCLRSTYKGADSGQIRSVYQSGSI